VTVAVVEDIPGDGSVTMMVLGPDLELVARSEYGLSAPVLPPGYLADFEDSRLPLVGGSGRDWYGAPIPLVVTLPVEGEYLLLVRKSTYVYTPDPSYRVEIR
jgi:hypothetical protein